MKSIPILILLVCMTSLSACKKDWLRVTPAGKVIPTRVEDYDDLLNDEEYFAMSTGSTGNPDILLGDEVIADSKKFANTVAPYPFAFEWDAKYGSIPEAGTGTIRGPSAVVENLPRYIYAYNLVINEVLNSKGEDQNQKKEVRAEALVYRAWAYLYLINLFGKPYNASTASSDPGFPIITVANATQTGFTRQSVQQVYDFIINDLKTAIPDLNTALLRTSRPIKSAAQAILAQAYLYQGKYPEALEQLNASFDDLMKSNAARIKLTDLKEAFGSGGSYEYDSIVSPRATILTDEKFQPLKNSETVFVRETLGQEFQPQGSDNTNPNQNAFFLAPWARKLFDPNDLRLKFYSPYKGGGDTKSDPSEGMLNKSGDMRRIGPQYNNIGVSLPNMYLMRAECLARTGNLNGAKTDLETLRMARLPSGKEMVPADIAGDKNKLIRFILDERVREFALTGMRWFDMRRLSTDPDFSNTVVTQHFTYGPEGSKSAMPDTTLNLVLPDRLTLKLPRSLLLEQPLLGDNP